MGLFDLATRISRGEHPKPARPLRPTIAERVRLVGIGGHMFYSRRCFAQVRRRARRVMKREGGSKQHGANLRVARLIVPVKLLQVNSKRGRDGRFFGAEARGRIFRCVPAKRRAFSVLTPCSGPMFDLRQSVDTGLVLSGSGTLSCAAVPDLETL